MDKERKKHLKKAGAKLIKERSKELNKMIKNSNPADIQDPRWAKNYKVLNRLGKTYRDNRSAVYPQRMIGVNFNILSVNLDLSNQYLPVQGYYLHCKKCGDLVPMNPELSLKCACGAVIFDTERKKISFDSKNVEAVKLIAKISPKNRGLMNFLSKLCASFKQGN